MRKEDGFNVPCKAARIEAAFKSALQIYRAAAAD